MKRVDLIKLIKYVVFLLFCVVFVYLEFAFSQEGEEGITYDPATGNYIIRYYGYEGNLLTVIYEPTTKIKPSVKAIVELNKDGTYTYNYKVFNRRDSIQRISSFGVEYFVPLSDCTFPKKGWHGGYYSFAPVFEWADADYDRMVSNAQGIGQGESLAGFSFKSRGLPGIVTCYFRGFIRHYVEDYVDEEGNPHPGFWTTALVFPEEAPQWVEDALKPIERFPNDTVQGKTIGPVPLPEVFKPISFLDNIIKLKEESVSLGWIKERGIARSLNAKLNSAKAALERNQIRTTKNILNAFLNQLEAQKDKHISSEAYGLLRFNVIYLRDNL